MYKRQTYAYEKAVAGEGRFIHTYKCDGNPLPSFEGEPKLVDIPDDIEAFTDVYKRQRMRRRSQRSSAVVMCLKNRKIST